MPNMSTYHFSYTIHSQFTTSLALHAQKCTKFYRKLFYLAHSTTEQSHNRLCINMREEKDLLQTYIYIHHNCELSMPLLLLLKPINIFFLFLIFFCTLKSIFMLIASFTSIIDKIHLIIPIADLVCTTKGITVYFSVRIIVINYSILC